MRVQPLTTPPVKIDKPKNFSELTQDYILKRFKDKATLCYDAYNDVYRVDVYKKIVRNIRYTQENYETPISYTFDPETGRVLSRTVTIAPSKVNPIRRIPRARGNSKTLDMNVAKQMMMKPARKMITTDVMGSHVRTTVVVPEKTYVKVMDNDYTTLGKLRSLDNNSLFGKFNRTIAPYLCKGSNDIKILDRRIGYAFLDANAPQSIDLYSNMRNLVSALCDDAINGRIITAHGEMVRKNIKIVDGSAKIITQKLQNEVKNVAKHPIALIENLINSIHIIKASGFVSDFIRPSVLSDLFKRVR